MISQPPTEPNLLPALSHLSDEWNMRGDKIHWETAITLAEMSALAYTVPHNRELVLRLFGFDEFDLLDEGPRSGFLALNDEVAVIAFRGTDEPEDWIANFDFYRRDRDDEGRELHRGFKAAYDCFAGVLKQRLSDHKPRRAWVTGHSLGAAMAACCALDLIHHNVPFTGLVTFGQPRIGNCELARFLDESTRGRYLRFVNEDDPVPFLPPGLGIRLPEYWHCGTRLRFKGGELERINGLTVFSAQAPDEVVASTTPAIITGKDGEETLTENEFLDLQEQLRAEQHYATKAPTPTIRSYSTRGCPQIAALPQSGDWIDSVIESIKRRIADHAIDEYMRQLNNFRRGVQGETP